MSSKSDEVEHLVIWGLWAQEFGETSENLNGDRLNLKMLNWKMKTLNNAKSSTNQ